MRTVAIVGVGLIGGSFGLSLRRAGFTGRILGVSSPETIESAVTKGAIDSGSTLEAAAGEADLIYLAQPISRILDTIGRLRSLVKPGALVTDAGSTKCAIAAKYDTDLPGNFCLGGHPMAGKERRGVLYAEAGLFEGRTYFLCPRAGSDLLLPPMQEFQEWLRRIGAVPVFIAPEEHDRLISFTSHLAQLSSTALACTLAEVYEADQARVGAGPGLADMTRLALSSWEIWRDIIATNVTAIDHALELYIEKLQEIRRDLVSDNTAPHFESAESFTKRLRNLTR